MQELKEAALDAFAGGICAAEWASRGGSPWRAGLRARALMYGEPPRPRIRHFGCGFYFVGGKEIIAQSLPELCDFLKVGALPPHLGCGADGDEDDAGNATVAGAGVSSSTIVSSGAGASSSSAACRLPDSQAPRTHAKRKRATVQAHRWGVASEKGQPCRDVVEVGQEVEVHLEDVGLAESYAATVIEMTLTQIEVEYVAFLAAETPRIPLREWVPTHQVTPPPPATPAGFHDALQKGSRVDLLYQDGWWQGRVVSVQDGAFRVKALDYGPVHCNAKAGVRPVWQFDPVMTTPSGCLEGTLPAWTYLDPHPQSTSQLRQRESRDPECAVVAHQQTGRAFTDGEDAGSAFQMVVGGSHCQRHSSCTRGCQHRGPCSSQPLGARKKPVRAPCQTGTPLASSSNWLRGTGGPSRAKEELNEAHDEQAHVDPFAFSAETRLHVQFGAGRQLQASQHLAP